MSTLKYYLLGVVVVALLVCLAATMVSAASLTITVTVVSDGITEKSIGATEGCSRFDIADITGANISNYRIWAGTSRLEPEDDDGVYGSPTIAEIKANPNVINWSAWDTQFHRQDTYFWSTYCPVSAQVSLYDMLVALKANGVAPVITVRNVDNHDNPAWAQAMNPPDSPEDWNEWWEHVFATVYWVNVLNNLEVHDWQVHNEPDNSSQGWGGTLADYITFTQYTADAIQYVYDTYLPGKSFRLYAPVSTHANEWITESLIQNDDIIDVIDWHRYGPPYDEAVTINDWIDQYDSDGVHEDLYCSEWGSYRGGYESHGNAMNYAMYLADHSKDTAGYVARSAIFPMYDWSSSMTGLVFADGSKTATYWAFRLMARGLDGGKTRYVITEAPPKFHNWVAAVDESTNTMYVEVLNKANRGDTVTLDVSAHVSSGTVTFRQYADGVNDVEIGTGSLNDGVITFSVPKSSIIQVIIPLGGGPPPTDTPVPPPTDTPVPPPTDTPGGPTDTPVPPTDTPEPGGVMHVGDIAMSFQQTGKNYKAQATVTILDAADAPVGSATVYGTFSGATDDSVSGDTGADGTVTLTSSRKKDGGTWTFCVDDVVRSGWTYDPAANVETCDTITAP